MKLSNKNKKKISSRTLMVRIVAIVLVLLMVLGTLTFILPYLGIGIYAANDGEITGVGMPSGGGLPTSGDNSVDDTELILGASLNSGEFNFAAFDTALADNKVVRVGLMYGDNVTVGFEVRATHGFIIGETDKDETFNMLWELPETLISITSDANLTKNAMTYSITSSQNTVIGGYHIETIWDGLQPLAQTIEAFKDSAENIDVFPAYINGTYKIRLGSFQSASAAEDFKSTLRSVLNDNFDVVLPSDTGVSIVDPNTDKILFEYDCGNESALGIAPKQVGSETTYLVTPAKNLYLGIFEFSRYRNGDTDGVQLVNILSIDEYTAGVLPYEINNNWPIEVQKAFAITVRTFTLSMLGRHSSTYGFDMCNTTHCQAYLGARQTNDTVRQAVFETAGMVLTYDGKPAKTYYSAVSGGVTVEVRDAWGGSVEYPYLTSIATPWENYAGHSKGSWSVEVTPEELLVTLQSKGYTNLKGSISDVNIDTLSKNSSYVYAITFTDIYGNKATVKTSDKIRTTLSAYINSANFVVAKGGQTVEMLDYSLASNGDVFTPLTGEVANTSADETPYIGGIGVSVITEDGVIGYMPQERIYIVKDIGSEAITATEVNLITGEGMLSYSITEEFNEIYARYSDSNPIADNIISFDGPLPDLSDILSLKTVTTPRAVTAVGNSKNFVFIGRGWGHGVGMSQYGALNLAQLGFDFKDILSAYFPGTEISFVD